MDYNWLWDFLSADLKNGRLQGKFLPGYRTQQGRAQLAKDRAYDETVRQAQAMAAAKEMALREKANEEARSAYNAAHGVAPMALAGPQVPNEVKSPQQRPYPGMGAPVMPPQRPYPGQGAPIRPPITQQVASPSPPQRRPAPPVAQPTQQISPQDYYALLKAGMFRMG